MRRHSPLVGPISILLSALVSAPAWATDANSGSVVAVVNVAPPPVRSVRVEVLVPGGKVVYDHCSDGTQSTGNRMVLGGFCSTDSPAVSVTNGEVNSRITIRATDFHPTSDPPNGPASATWALGPFTPERPDRVTVQEFEYGATDALATTDICDATFLANCTDPTGTAPGDVGLKYFQLYAPTSSTSSAENWSSTVTWTATEVPTP